MPQSQSLNGMTLGHIIFQKGWNSSRFTGKYKIKISFECTKNL